MKFVFCWKKDVAGSIASKKRLVVRLILSDPVGYFMTFLLPSVYFRFLSRVNDLHRHNYHNHS
jgi:hypothetical protein